MSVEFQSDGQKWSMLFTLVGRRQDSWSSSSSFFFFGNIYKKKKKMICRSSYRLEQQRESLSLYCKFNQKKMWDPILFSFEIFLLILSKKLICSLQFNENWLNKKPVFRVRDINLELDIQSHLCVNVNREQSVWLLYSTWFKSSRTKKLENVNRCLSE